MKRFLAIFLFALPVTCFPQANPAASEAVLEASDNLFCSGFEACSSYCGDGSVDPGELCDDGNQIDGDGCSANCLSDETCGNDIIDYAAGETCDDGNTQGGDGCSASCQLGCAPDSARLCELVNAEGSCPGFETCEAGDWTSCSAPQPTPEVCDYLDNNCDDTIDEPFIVGVLYLHDEHCGGCNNPCAGRFPNAVGFCEVQSGAAQCGFTCNEEFVDLNLIEADGCEQQRAPEICDGIDNDYDGAIDEGFPGLGESCSVGVGACQQFGTLTCDLQDPAGPVICNATPGIAGSEQCNGIDDDCDGEIDNGVSPESCATQTGVCQGSTKLCVGTIGHIECSFGEYGPDYEVWELSCDGLDNDCDGATDNDLPVQPCPSQEGVCAGSVKNCAGIAGWQACGPAEYGGDYEPDEVTCDYQDNDCDGQVDEPFDLTTDANNCGYCGNACATPPNSTPNCQFSACGHTCEDNYYDCDFNPSNGCESIEPCP